MSHTPEELSSRLASLLGDRVSNPDAFATAVLEHFAQFTPSRVEGEISTNFEYIKAYDPLKGGLTIKPGNIRLNWRKPPGGVAAGGTSASVCAQQQG